MATNPLVEKNASGSDHGAPAPGDWQLHTDLAFAATGVVTFEADPSSRLILGSHRLAELFGLAPEDKLIDAFTQRVDVDDRPHFEALLAGNGDAVAFRVRVAPNTSRWLRGVAKRHPSRPVVIGALSDITSQKELEDYVEVALDGGRRPVAHQRRHDRRDDRAREAMQTALNSEARMRAIMDAAPVGIEDLLLSDVNHRAKNLLAVVQAIARQTLSEPHEQTGAALLLDRYRSLAISHDLIVNNSWKGVDLTTLATQTLSPFGAETDKRIAIIGPQLLITPTAAQTLGMCIHELATNAVKYGVLSAGKTGKITLSWQLARNDQIEITWLETGAAEQPWHSAARGFGYRVLAEGAPYMLEGKASLNNAPGTLTWTLEAPASRIIASL